MSTPVTSLNDGCPLARMLGGTWFQEICRDTKCMHAALLKSAGQDVVKKSSTRKNRYLMVFNCQIAPIPGAKLVRSRPS